MSKPSMTLQEILSAIESILFISGDPVSLSRLMSALELSEGEIANGLEHLIRKYETPESGLSLVRMDDRVQLTTKSGNAAHLEQFIKTALQESLSKAALEVLAVIAYRGPIARSEIEAIRGVNCSVTLRNLLMRELIDRKENNDDAREYLYHISFQCLKALGVQRSEDLPDYEILVRDDRLLSALHAAQNSLQV